MSLSVRLLSPRALIFYLGANRIQAVEYRHGVVGLNLGQMPQHF